MSNPKIDPIYQDHFVGIWKRTNVIGGQSQAPEFLIFNKDETFSMNPYTQGTSNGNVEEVSEGDGHGSGEVRKGKMLLSLEDRKISLKFTLQNSTQAESEFNPLSGDKAGQPRYNTLEFRSARGGESLVAGTRQLYAFFSYPFSPNMQIEDLLEQVK